VPFKQIHCTIGPDGKAEFGTRPEIFHLILEENGDCPHGAYELCVWVSLFHARDRSTHKIDRMISQSRPKWKNEGQQYAAMYCAGMEGINFENQANETYVQDELYAATFGQVLLDHFNRELTSTRIPDEQALVDSLNRVSLYSPPRSSDVVPEADTGAAR